MQRLENVTFVNYFRHTRPYIKRIRVFILNSWWGLARELQRKGERNVIGPNDFINASVLNDMAIIIKTKQ